VEFNYGNPNVTKLQTQLRVQMSGSYIYTEVQNIPTAWIPGVDALEYHTPKAVHPFANGMLQT
jgi:hypothetical protein